MAVVPRNRPMESPSTEGVDSTGKPIARTGTHPGIYINLAILLMMIHSQRRFLYANHPIRHYALQLLHLA